MATSGTFLIWKNDGYFWRTDWFLNRLKSRRKKESFTKSPNLAEK